MEPIELELQKARQNLLDLSVRNRLISTPRQATRSKRLEIVDEISKEVFRILVIEKKAMTFLPSSGETEIDDGDPEDVAQGLSQPDEKEPAADRHTDLRLQTRLTSEALQTRLLGLFYDARTYIEEHGVNILYLALGFLKWYEAPNSDKPRFAPLLLIPVDLARASVGSRFRLTYRDEEIATNLSLQAKLQREFQVALPDVPVADEFEIGDYFDAVVQSIVDKPRWEVVRNDMVLWFFSFAKFLMFRDLESANWPKDAPLSTNELLNRILREGFAGEPPICGESQSIDDIIAPEQMVHVTDADSSQTLVIEEVRRGRNLIVQGPPGTGKSQTIVNAIAAAVKEGKRVLFVAEKMAALEVVKSRLDKCDLGAICLELHSHLANKKSVLAELSKTLLLGRPKAVESAETFDTLRAERDRLNRHAVAMNTPQSPANYTPYEMLGHLARHVGAEFSSIELKLDEAPGWTRSHYFERRALIQDVQSQMGSIGVPARSLWNGVTLDFPPLPTDVLSIIRRISKARQSLEQVRELVDQLATAFRIGDQKSLTVKSVRVFAKLIGRVVDAPPMDRRHIANPIWEERHPAIAELVAAGQKLAACQETLNGKVTEVAWRTDLAEVRKQIAAFGGSWLRWLRGSYRDAVAVLKSVANGELPNDRLGRLAIVDALVEGQAKLQQIAEDPATAVIGAAAFGVKWGGVKSNWAELAAIVTWEQTCRDEKLPSAFRQLAARMTDPDACRTPASKLRESLESLGSELRATVQDLGLDVRRAFAKDDIEFVPVDAAIDRFREWCDHSESLSKWVAYWSRRVQLEKTGLASLGERLHDGSIAAQNALGQFEFAYFESLLRHCHRLQPEIASFDGETFEQCIKRFCDLDLRRIALAKQEVAIAHFEGLPRNTGIGELATVRREIEKKRNHKPLRALLREAGAAIQSIKPVFMMSPISIAQFLDPGVLNFDLLLIDEASQVKPVDALGAICRAKQVVVVGDSKQLPPSNFFAKMLDDDSDGDSADSAGDLESILGLCAAKGMQERMLRWHYRSRHDSLIAVSNREFYDNRLLVVPSPTVDRSATGLRFRRVEGGVFDRGGAANNRIEAQAVARAVIEQARVAPTKSLGVGAFSVSQRDAIRAELELLLRREGGLEAFFAAGKTEPFFIKNLENIQGDERDVIFISVGYARDSSGYMAMNFGPLTNDGGERRLNVLISRARERCDVFSSIVADDIKLETTKSRGTAAFKTFLRYAETGILDDRMPLDREPDSEFERQVAAAIKSLGYDVHCQVGSSGFIIDLAVVDPDFPGRYAVGIECDGATYHSSRSARDRDRLRQQVLEDRGWNIHRIWSTDWFHRPKIQLQKAVDAIEAARRKPSGQSVAIVAELPEEATIERGSQPIIDVVVQDSPASSPYLEAQFAVPTHQQIHDVPHDELSIIVERIVQIEAPVHRDEVARRVASLWRLERAGKRIVAAVAAATDFAIRAGRLVDAEGFLTSPAQQAVPVRSREATASASLRRPELLPPMEIRAAVMLLVQAHLGARRDELRRETVKLIGFRSTSAQLKQIVDAQIDLLIAGNRIVDRDGRFFLPDA